MNLIIVKSLASMTAEELATADPDKWYLVADPPLPLVAVADNSEWRVGVGRAESRRARKRDNRRKRAKRIKRGRR